MEGKSKRGETNNRATNSSREGTFPIFEEGGKLRWTHHEERGKTVTKVKGCRETRSFLLHSPRGAHISFNCIGKG